MNNPETNLKLRELEEWFRVGINRFSIENLSNTPDFILSAYLIKCLMNFQCAVNDRDTWYRKDK